MARRGVRAAALLAAAGLPVLLGLRAAVTALRTGPLAPGGPAVHDPGRLPAELVLSGAALLALVLGPWLLACLAATALACVRQAGPGSSVPLAGPLRVPVVVRLVVVVLVVGLPVAPAAGAHPGHVPTRDGLRGLVLPERDVGLPHAGHRHRVGPGESLWRITEDHLARYRPQGRTGPAAVARAWPRLYHANRSAVGRDPDLLLTGTVLDLQVLHRPDAAGRPATRIPSQEHP